MNKKLLFYVGFFAVLLLVFYAFVLKDYDFSASPLPVISKVPSFTFTNQDGKTIGQKETDDKVYVVEYFFTTCKGICPKMNANMRRIFDAYKDEKEFMIISHTCMPEVDSVPQLKAYEQKMVNNKLLKSSDGVYSISNNTDDKTIQKNTNWNFVTGSKDSLYKMARVGYVIDNQKPDSSQNIANQFIHTQFFAVVDRYRRVRAIYDGLKEEEIQKLLHDIKGLLKEKIDHTRFMTGFSNSPT